MLGSRHGRMPNWIAFERCCCYGHQAPLSSPYLMTLWWMSMWIKSGLIPLLISYLVALILMVMPMPAFLEAWRPDWLSLVILYWVIALPHRVGIGSVLILGLVADILMGTVFGIYATALLIMAYPAIRHFHRIRNYSFLSQP